MPLVMANETGGAQQRTAGHFGRVECAVQQSLIAVRRQVQVHLDWDHAPHHAPHHVTHDHHAPHHAPHHVAHHAPSPHHVSHHSPHHDVTPAHHGFSGPNFNFPAGFGSGF